MVESHAKRVAAGKKAAATRRRDVRSGRAKPYYPRKSSRGTRATSVMSKIKWGEAALSLAVGYFGGKMMQDTGAPEYLYQRFPEFRKLTASNAGQTAGDAINKDLGLAAMAKVAYDAVVHHRLDQTSTSILIPYALGTVFDKNKGSSDGGAW